MALAVVLTALAANAEPPSPQVLPHAAHGLFTGEQWRYRRDNLLGGTALRIVADLVSIPTGAPWWNGGEWALFGGVMGTTVGLSVGTPSLDVRFQDLVHERFLGPDRFSIWNQTGDLIIWSAAGAATLGLLIYGLISGDDLAAETAMLMAEAFAVAQLYHNLIKLLVGRAGPRETSLQGHYFGPAGGVQLWPAGTPSGHMASMYALLSVLMHTIDHPALWVGLNAFALVFGASLVGDQYHWVSDVILGAAIGFCVGRWVVRHRSTLYVYGDDPPPTVQFNLVPLLMPGQGAGFGVVGTF
ncbi:MAG: phosphatase PAP2 family protein [Archangium sp.]|nr:phosphatase PAP2 family protein [Archangium sp.]MDP3158127.1 phosphatase PAP2 family protein [Archangium sp.]MDP3570466.1 phosphatase PAP2 family protein [Archangium sp.]